MINKITEALNKADSAYYNTGKALMSDADYDKLKDKLRKLDPNNAVFTKVGAKVEAHRSEVKLLMHMGSQNKANTDEEFFKWYDKTGGQVVISDKQDGSSMEIVYKDGKLNRVSSRGDGITGLDLTQNALLWSNLPKTININGQLIVRAEAYMNISVWKERFSDSANPRNCCNGLVSRKTDEEKDNQHVRIAAFDIVHPTINFKTQLDKFNTIRELGFDTVRYFVASTVLQIKAIRTEYIESRSKLDYEIDGMVVSFNDLEVQERLGYSDGGTRPNGMVAWKLETSKGITKIINMTISMGSAGQIVPTAQVEPSFIGGVTISNVLLNNFDYIKELGVNIGSRVLIQRSGDVIPNCLGDVDAIYECPECKFRGTIDEQIKHHKE